MLNKTIINIILKNGRVIKIERDDKADISNDYEQLKSTFVSGNIVGVILSNRTSLLIRPGDISAITISKINNPAMNNNEIVYIGDDDIILKED